jgi:hypothetical protein
MDTRGREAMGAEGSVKPKAIRPAVSWVHDESSSLYVTGFGRDRVKL